MTRKNVNSLAIVVLIGLIVQVGFVLWDCKSTPADTAVSFARDYYRLSPSMAEWICGASPKACCKSENGAKSSECPKAASTPDPEKCKKTAFGNGAADSSETDCCEELARRVNTAVEKYLYKARKDATERGFDENFAKYTLYHIETRTEYLDDATAVVHLTAHRRLQINPVYAYIGRLFRIGETDKVDASIRVKLEDGRWRVCPTSLSSLKAI